MTHPDDQDRTTAVVLCECAGSLSKSLDFAGLTDRLTQLPAVSIVRRTPTLCRKAECAKMVKDISKTAERLVIAGCSEDVLSASLQQAVKKSKIDDSLLLAVNIREHCARVHRDTKVATDKAFDLINAAVRRLVVSEPADKKTIQICREVVVLGGGIAGLQTADALAELGHPVTLITKNDKLGGCVEQWPELYGHLADDSDAAVTLVQKKIAELIGKVTSNNLITICLNASLKAVKNHFGGFSVVATSNGSEREFTAGAVVLALGAMRDSDSQFQAAKNGGHITDLEGLMQIINSGRIPGRIAMVTDVLGPQGRGAWSQVLSAAELLAKQHGVELHLYCQNAQVAAMGMESLYRRVRQAGMTVVKCETTPEVSQNGSKATVRSTDPILGAGLSEQFDLVVMADQTSAAGGGGSFNTVAGLRLGPEGLQYDDVWLLPTDTNRKGVFVVGGARGDSDFRQALTDGLAAATEIHALLAEQQIEVYEKTVAVDPDKCVLCLTCLRICPHGAISIDTENKVASVSSVACNQCGLCASECPATAIQLTGYTDSQMTAEIGCAPEYTVFACENSGYHAATAAGACGLEYSEKVRLVRVPCAGKVDARHVLAALERGAAKVAIIGCHPENCRYLSGSSRAERRVAHIQNILERAGYDPSQVSFGGITSMESRAFVQYMHNL